ncbi:MAG: hypothetical protein AB7I19_11215 [Planctomycetota bacterium]
MQPDAELPTHRIRAVPLRHSELLGVPGFGRHPTYDFVIERLRRWS